MLQELAAEHEDAFLRFIDDFRSVDPVGLECIVGDSKEWNPARFKKFVKESEKQKLDWRPGPKKLSITRYVYLAENGDVRALGLMRFPLDEETENSGGNLICAVAPSLRRKGFGSYCLALMLFEAVRAGLRRVLITCPANNTPMRRVAEKNRGVLEAIVESKAPKAEAIKTARYWISFS